MRASVDRCLAALAHTLPSDAILTDLAVREAHASDESGLTGRLPDAVLRPLNTEQVATILRAASEYRVPVTPRAAGTGKTGGAVPVEGGLVLSLGRFDRILEVDALDGVAVVEPGVITDDLHRAVEAEQLFWGPDPSSSAQCTVGGNIATNAGGPRTFKYGPTRDWVLGLEAVSGDGRVLSLGRRTAKGVTGYDLTSVVVGSEGTLAVVTRATLRLAPRPESVALVLAFLPSLEAIAPAIASALRAHVSPRCVELLDDRVLDVLRGGATKLPIPAAARALLAIELDGRPEHLEREAERLGEALRAHTDFDPLVAFSREDRERFWSVRRDMSYALRRSARFKLSEDVAVPRRRLAELIAHCRRIEERFGIRMPTYGHAGDGNLHVNLLWESEDQQAAVQSAIRALFESTVQLGGTLSGEHGIGLAKAEFLPLEHSPAVLAMEDRIKRSFDPAGVLNPGKVLPTRR